MGRDGAVVLRSKTITETESPGLAALKIKAADDGDDEEECSHGNGQLGIREMKVHYVLLCGILRNGRQFMGSSRGGKEPSRSPP
jgi:hypothetical protein